RPLCAIRDQLESAVAVRDAEPYRLHHASLELIDRNLNVAQEILAAMKSTRRAAGHRTDAAARQGHDDEKQHGDFASVAHGGISCQYTPTGSRPLRLWRARCVARSMLLDRKCTVPSPINTLAPPTW